MTIDISADLLVLACRELDDLRERHADTQVSRALAHREGDLSRSQIDDIAIGARIEWDNRNPSLARLRRGWVTA
jgi:hypothetical protein